MADTQRDNVYSLRQRRRFKSKTIFRALFRILISVAIIEGIWFGFTGMAIKPVAVKWDTIEKGCWMDALFLRDETLITADRTGNLDQKQISGARLPIGDVVAQIISDDTSDSSNTDLTDFKRLEELQREEGLSQKDLQQVEVALQPNLQGSSQKVGKTPPDFNYLQQEKARILRNIQVLQQQIAMIDTKNYNASSGNFISAPVPGFLYFQYDEMESKLTPEKINQLTEADFIRQYPLKSPGSKVESGTVIGKIIDPFHQTVAVLIDTRQTGIPQVGDDWRVKCPSLTQEAKISQTVPLENHKMIVGLDLPAIIATYAPERSTRLYVIYHQVTGATVPMQALFHKGKETVVRIVDGDSYRLQKVHPVESDGNQVIVEGIDSGTTILSR